MILTWHELQMGLQDTRWNFETKFVVKCGDTECPQTATSGGTWWIVVDEKPFETLVKAWQSALKDLAIRNS